MRQPWWITEGLFTYLPKYPFEKFSFREYVHAHGIKEQLWAIREGLA